MKPNLTGEFIIYDTPNHVTEVDSTAIAATDAAITDNKEYPYAYSGTLQTNYDLMNIYFDSTTTLPSSMKWSAGLFIDQESDFKSDFMFRCVASFSGWSNQDTANVYAYFGRTDSATVTNSVAAPQNDTTDYQLLPVNGVASTPTSATNLLYSVDQTIVAKYEEDNPFVFGFGFIQNNAVSESIKGTLSMSIYKYRDVNEVFRPSGN